MVPPAVPGRLEVGDKALDLPPYEATAGNGGLGIGKLLATTGLVTVDPGFMNTAACTSDITFIDGEAGILRYRGYPIEQIAAQSNFVEAAQLVIWGELPSAAQAERFNGLIQAAAAMPEDFRHHFQSFPTTAHPMAILSAMVNSLQTYDLPGLVIEDNDEFEKAAASLMSKIRTVAAAAFRTSRSEPIMYPRYDLSYTENFLHMMFSKPYHDYVQTPEASRALDLFLTLHADHEQNCSTSTVRMVASGEANLYASVAAGICALWGPLHGGANQAVMEMLTRIQTTGMSTKDFISQVKDKSSGTKLMGFGHRVYRNFDPRATILKKAADDLLNAMHIRDPRLEIARELERTALEDEYFVERKLYPNVDFYSGIILTALGIPTDMFTVMFAIGRMPGWIANWAELHTGPFGTVDGRSVSRIYRPRQIYVGKNQRDYVPSGAR
jgi:citrate synthase